jgi:hypothetical protein
MASSVMKRNMDLIREILLHVENYTPPNINEVQLLSPLDFSGSFAENLHNISLLIKDGYLRIAHTDTSGAVYIEGMSMKGHDLLDAIRDSSVWEATKARVNQVGGFTLDIILAVAKDYLQKKILSLGE